MLEPSFTTRPVIEGTFGVVASTHWLATAVGMSILERGGNAFDAGVATAFTLQVVEPHLNGPCGEAPIMLFDVRRQQAEVICAHGPAPAAARIERFHELGLDLIPGTGLLAPCVPGAFDGLMLMLRDYGTLPLREVLEAAISYARHGYPVVERITATIESVAELFHNHWPSSAAVYLPYGAAPQPGEMFANPTLANTYERILRGAENTGADRIAQIEVARRIWSQGFVAEAIDEVCRNWKVMDVSGRRHGGLLTGQDMASWEANVEAPIFYDYGRFRVLKPDTWTQGLAALQQLALLKGFDLGRLRPTDPEFIHIVVECSKLAFADRDTYYGDPRHVAVPIETLLSEHYNDARRSLIGEQASVEIRPGEIAGFGRPMRFVAVGDTRDAVSAGGAGEPTVGRVGAGETIDVGLPLGDTVHFDIIDQSGNMVSATPSGGWLQSSPVIPKLGFGLGTRAQMFVLDHKHPAGLAPGRRPRSTLSPAMALRDGKPYLVWGTPGGDQQDQWIPQFLLRHIHAGHNLQEAIDAPAWHTEHFPSSFWPRTARPGVLVVEGRMPQLSIDELRRRGHRVEVGLPWSEGRLTAASQEGVRRRAAANPRGMQAYAAGR
jgi:gamma-glutamyltranspeptidase / glutathione hydrolase